MAIVAIVTASVASAGLPNALAYVVARDGFSARALLRHGRNWLIGSATFGLIAGGATVALMTRGPLAGVSVWLIVPWELLWIEGLMATQLVFACLQGERCFRVLNWFRLINPFVASALAFAFLLWLRHASLELGIIVFTVAGVVGAVTGGVICRRVLSPRMDHKGEPPSLSSMLRYGVRSIPGSTAPLETFSIDQGLVGLLLSPYTLGLYVVGGAFNNLPSLVLMGIGSVALPKVAAEHDHDRRVRLLRGVLLGSSFAALSIVVAVEGIVGWLLPLAFGHAFSHAVPVARLLILAGFFLSMRRVLGPLLLAIGCPGHGAIAEGLGLCVLAAMAATLIPAAGITGAAVALTVAAAAADGYMLGALIRTLNRLPETPSRVFREAVPTAVVSWPETT